MNRGRPSRCWIACGLTLALLASGAVPASAASTLALSVPKTGRFARLAQEIEFGVLKAIEDAVTTGAERPEMYIIDDACSGTIERAEIDELREVGVDIVIGAPCFEPAYALVRGLADTGRAVPVIALGIRHVDVEQPIEDGLPFYVLAPSATAEADAIADLLLPRWRDRPFALLDDGSVQGRTLSDQLRERAEQRGLKPLQTVTFRPLQSNYAAALRRLAATGVEAAFVAGEPEDVATMAANAAAFDPPIEIASGEAGELLPLIDLPSPLQPGVLAVTQDRPVDQPSATILLERLTAISFPASDPLLQGYALAQIALDALASDEPISERTFDTVLGPIVFGTDQRAALLPYRLRRWNGRSFDVIAR